MVLTEMVAYEAIWGDKWPLLVPQARFEMGEAIIRGLAAGIDPSAGRRLRSEAKRYAALRATQAYLDTRRTDRAAARWEGE